MNTADIVRVFEDNRGTLTPQMLELLVPWHETRDFLKETGWVPTETETAGLICYAPFLLQEDKLRLLAKVRRETHDAALHRRLTDLLTRQGTETAAIKSSKGPPHIYTLERWGADEADAGLFADWISAYRAGMTLGEEFNIVWMPVDAAEDTRVHANLMYDSEGKLLSQWSSFHEADWPIISVRQPNPFERGDIVRIIGSEDDWDIGILENDRDSWAEYVQAGAHACSDHDELVLTIMQLMNNGGFSHTHAQPFDLERIEDRSATALSQESWDLLKSGQALYRGTGTLAAFMDARQRFLEAQGAC